MNTQSLDELRVWLPGLRPITSGSPLIERALASVRRLGSRLALRPDLDEPVWPQLTGYPYGPSPS
jgi:hypothetical protein